MLKKEAKIPNFAPADVGRPTLSPVLVLSTSPFPKRRYHPAHEGGEPPTALKSWTQYCPQPPSPRPGLLAASTGSPWNPNLGEVSPLAQRESARTP